jgi:hypothetical protein
MRTGLKQKNRTQSHLDQQDKLQKENETRTEPEHFKRSNAVSKPEATQSIAQSRLDQDIQKMFPPQDKCANHRKVHAPRNIIMQRSKQP